MNSRKLKAHHPNISFGWGNATVSLQTKKIKGLHGSYQEVPSAKLMCIEARSETLKLRRIWRLVFHALARGQIVRALGDTQTPAIPIRWLGNFDVHRTGPTYRPSSTFARHILGSCLVFYRR